MNIKKFITLTLSFLLILSTFAGCRKVGENASSSNTSDVTSNVYGVVDVVENSDSDIESTDSTASEATDSDTSSGNEGSSSVDSSIFTENIVFVGDGGNPDGSSNDDTPATFVDPDSAVKNEVETPEGEKITVYESGDFETSPNSKTGNFTTIWIAAGKSVNYKVRGAIGKYFTIKSSNVSVVCNNKTYQSKNGEVRFLVESDEHALASTQIAFQIINNGSKPESFTCNLASPLGTWDNKEKIESISEEFNITINPGDEDGYWYEYKAVKDGTLKFYLLSGTDTGTLMVTNNSNSAQRSTDIDDELKSDGTGKYIELQVKSGNVIVINLASKVTDAEATLKFLIK